MLTQKKPKQKAKERRVVVVLPIARYAGEISGRVWDRMGYATKSN